MFKSINLATQIFGTGLHVQSLLISEQNSIQFANNLLVVVSILKTKRVVFRFSIFFLIYPFSIYLQLVNEEKRKCCVLCKEKVCIFL